MPFPTSNDSARRTDAVTVAGVRLPFDKRMLLLIAAALVLFAVVGGVFLGMGAGQGSPVKQDAASNPLGAEAPDLGASAQMELMTGKSALGGSSASLPVEPGAIVAPGGVELQRQDPVPAAPSAATPSASEPSTGASGAQDGAEMPAPAASMAGDAAQHTGAAPAEPPTEPVSR